MFCQPDRLVQRIEWRVAGKVCEGFKRTGNLFECVFFFCFVFSFFFVCLLLFVCCCFVLFDCLLKLKVNNELSQTCFKISRGLHE